MKRLLSMSALIVAALIFTASCASAYNYKYVGDRSAGYEKRINGGRGCIMGDCSKKQERLKAQRPTTSCSSRAESCRSKNSLKPGVASRCEPARMACLKTGTFVTLSGERRAVDLRE